MTGRGNSGQRSSCKGALSGQLSSDPRNPYKKRLGQKTSYQGSQNAYQAISVPGYSDPKLHLLLFILFLFSIFLCIFKKWSKSEEKHEFGGR